MTVATKTWVTYVQNDDQVTQALILGQSLRRVVTAWKLVIFTDDSLSKINRIALEKVFDYVVIPEGITQKNGTSFQLYCKMSCWSLYWAERCIFIEPDALVLKNCDELMEIEEVQALLKGTDEIDIHSGLFVCKPSLETFKGLFKLNSYETDEIPNAQMLKRNFGKYLKCKSLEEESLFSVVIDPRGPLDLLNNWEKNTEIPIVRLEGATPTNIIKVKEILPSGDFTKAVISQWLEIFYLNVEPLFKSLEQPMEKQPEHEPIAIVGMGCRFPGANSLEEFWKLLIEGGDGIISIPAFRLPPGVSPDLEVVKNLKAGFLTCPVNECDGKFFNISPLELSFLDPQTRILLEVLWESLEDAGIDPLTLKGTNAGIFTGSWTQDYKELINQKSPPTEDFFRKYMGNSIGAAAGRLSFILGVTGPNVATESGCSSSMIGLDIACNKLRLGETSLAMACGVNLVLHNFTGNDMDSICAKDSHCKTFDAAADGFGRAEGCGVLILKRYSQAVKDGDRIHALIRGTGSAQEGISRSLGTPTVACEAMSMKMALNNAGVKPWEVSYVEAHGTGTPVGDPMEMAAIAEAYSEGRNGTERLIVGSVKTNIGHTESCSGIAGIIKTVLALQNEVIPPHINFKTLNPNVDIDAVPASIPLEATPWKRTQGKIRYAGVSSFGITGTDAHAIIQEAPEIQPKNSVDFGMSRPQHLLTLSAKTEAALDALLTKFKKHLQETSSQTVGDITFTANTGRAHFPHRAAILGKSCTEIAKNIEKQAWEVGKVRDEAGQKICFLFTGQGSQYIGMGKSLYEASPEFKHHFDICEEILKKKLGISIKEVIWPKNKSLSSDPTYQTGEISRTIYSQTSIFCIEFCLLKLWESWGIHPHCVVGHSLGEFAAATAAGILSLEDALTLVAERSRLIDNLPRGQMIVLKEDKKSVEKHLKEFQDGDENVWLDIAAVNSEEQTVLSGDTEYVEKLSEFCKNNKIKSVILQATHAFHSRHMDPMLEEYRQISSKLTYGVPTCKFVSGMEGKTMEIGEVNADYWVRHTRQSVEFKDACKAAYTEGCRIFLEIGPQPILSALTTINSSEFDTKDYPINCLPSLRKNADDWTIILTSLSKLFTSGVKVDWRNFDKFYCRRKVALPNYPFQRKKFWFDENSKTNPGAGGFQHLLGIPIHPLIGCILPNATPSSIYQARLDLDKIPYVRDHLIGETVIYPGAGFLEMSMAAGFSTTQGLTSKFEFPSNPISFQNLVVEAPLQLIDKEACPVQVIVTPDPESSGSKVTVYSEKHTSSGLETDDSSRKRKWIRHCTGNYFPFPLDYEEEKTFLGESLAEIRNRIQGEKDVAQYYEEMDKLGLKYGPNFRRIQRLWHKKETTELIAEITIPADAQDYLCHPSVIDAVLQAFIGNSISEISHILVPVRIEKFIWFANIEVPTDGDATLFAHCFPKPGTQSPRSVALYNKEGTLLALMSGLEVIQTTVPAVLSALKNQNMNIPPLFEDVWKPVGGPLQNRFEMTQFFENRDEIMSEEFLKDLLHFNDEMDIDKEFFPHLNYLCYLYGLKSLYSLGWKAELGEVIQAAEFCEKFSVLKSHTTFLNRLLMIIGEEGYLTGVKDHNGTFTSWTVTSCPPPVETILTEIESTKKVLGVGTPQVYGPADILAVCSEKLADVLLGNASAIDLLFGTENENGETRADVYYRLATLTKYKFYVSVSRLLFENLRKNIETGKSSHEVLQILEVGAGTGTLTKVLIPILEEFKIPYRYTFTDISAGFFIKAQKTFEPYAKKMVYKTLDLEKDPFVQGFYPEEFDFVVAVNVLHICKDLSQCVRNLRQLTVPEGVIGITETTKPYREIDLLFGMFEGYWQFEDLETRPNHPLVSSETWLNIFRANGYSNGVTCPAHRNHGGMMIGKATRTRPTYIAKHLETKPKSWIIFSDGNQEKDGFFLDKLQSCGRKVSWIRKTEKCSNNFANSSYEINPREKSDMQWALTEIMKESVEVEGVIYLWGDLEDERDQELICEPFLYLSQIIGTGLFKPLPKLIFLTHGLFQVGDHIITNPSPSTIWGFAKTLRQEISNFQCKGIDLKPIDSNTTVDQIYGDAFLELWKNDGEFQVAYRQKTRYVLRLTSGKFTMSPLMIPNSEKYSLALPSSKIINDLRIIPNPDSNLLKEDEVEIETKAIALNFKDIFAILKPIKEFERFNSVGADFSGVVTAVGSNVTNRKIGDAVFGCVFDGGAVPSHHVTKANEVLPIPDHWTFEEAVTLPVVFATAYYCMVTVADLKKHETILIHAASGGVGLVAIQLAKHLGARIIATAGNRRKRAYLRNLGIEHVFNSRTLEYEQQILEVTGGKGVEMVLNCLTGSGFKEASLNVCGPGARFVEMSKMDVWKSEEVAIRRPDVEYTVADLTRVEPETWVMLMKEMLEFMELNLVRPIPYTAFDVIYIREALNYLQKAKHIGKVIVKMPSRIIKKDNKEIETKFKMFNDRSAYLITGGCGGIGLEIAKWMVNSGAKHIILVGRSLPNTKACETMESLNKMGADVRNLQVDVGDFEECQRLLETLKDPSFGMPTLRGIMHAAGTLSDALLENQSWSKFESTFRPKVNGSWNLHNLTKDYPLEHFVMYSSAVAVVGNIGQSNHAAGNAYLDALTHHRVSIGLPALTVNWGQWGEVGVAAEIKVNGYRPFSPREGILALEMIMKSQKAQGCVADADFNIVVKLSSLSGKHLEEVRPKLGAGGEGLNWSLKLDGKVFMAEFDSAVDYSGKVEVSKKYLDIIIRQILKLEADDELDPDQDLMEQGFDSLMMVELKNAIQTLLGSDFVINPNDMNGLSSVKLGSEKITTMIIESKGDKESG